MDDLRKLQLVELDMLKEFIKVCEKLNLNYYLVGGTLIGCIRHKGFIPWDDDIDVAMPRYDYQIFLEKGQEYLPENLFIQTYKTDNEYTHNFAKIRNSNTTFIETTSKSHNINHGVYIDIFPLDNCSSLPFLQKYNDFRKNLYNLQLEKYYYYESNLNKSFKGKIAKLISDFMYHKLNLKEIQEKKEKLFTKYNKKNTKFCINYSGAWGIKEIWSKEDFSEKLLLDFEDILVSVPKGYDRILKHVYGEYMKLPIKEKQITHHYTEHIDLDKSYLLYKE